MPGWPAHWAGDVVLADGGTAFVRPIAPADASRLAAFHARLSPESIYFRFFSPHPRLSTDELDRFTNVDHDARAALVMLIGEELIGVGRYDRLARGDTAEVAFVVSDAHQGRGVATLLLERLAAAARERGLRRFSADVLPHNRAMLGVFHDAGFDVASRFEDGIVRLVFPIDRTPRAAAAARRRERTAQTRSLARLLAPRGVGVIAQGADGERAARTLVRRLSASGYAGPVRALSAFAPAGDVRNLDLVFVAVPPELLPAQIDRCGAWGVRGAVVLATGAESDEALAERGDRDLAVRARRDGLRLIGPASLGLARAAGAAPFEALAVAGRVDPGALALFVESPQRGRDALEALASRGLGVSCFVSAGRKADVSASDALTLWESDAETRAIGLVLRGLGNPRRTLDIARRVARRKPVLLWLADHPGEPPAALAIALGHAGIVRCAALDELLDLARSCVAREPAQEEPRTAELTTGRPAERRGAARPPRRPPGTDRFAARALVDSALGAGSPRAALRDPDARRLLALYGVGGPAEPIRASGRLLRVEQDAGWGGFLVLEEDGILVDARIVPLGERDVRALASRAPKALAAEYANTIRRVAALAADVPELAACALVLPSRPGERAVLVAGSARVAAVMLGPLA